MQVGVVSDNGKREKMFQFVFCSSLVELVEVFLLSSFSVDKLKTLICCFWSIFVDSLIEKV